MSNTINARSLSVKPFDVPIGFLGNERGGSRRGGILKKNFSSCLILFVNFIAVN